ncbi:MAG: riboflavin kinase [Alphaproteobacteria bacterium]
MYDKRVRVQLLRFIRPERKFESFDALKAQIAADADAARADHQRA